jgi:hypothetical protein
VHCEASCSKGTDHAHSKNGFFGLMKSFDSAESSFKSIPGVGLTATLKHELMRGVTIDHLIWWFHNIDRTTTFNGRDFNDATINAYKLWHPLDHIKVKWKKKSRMTRGTFNPGLLSAFTRPSAVSSSMKAVLFRSLIDKASIFRWAS